MSNIVVTETAEQRLRCAGSVGVRALPVVAELGDGPLLALGLEDRVEAEAARAARLVGDPALEDPCASHLVTLGREGDELADVTGATAVFFDAFELLEDALDVHACREPGGLDPRRAAQAFDLEPRVLAEDPGTGPVDGPPEDGFAASVLVVRLADLRRVVVGIERLDLPAGQSVPQLT